MIPERKDNEKYNKEQSEKVRENNPVIINILLILAAVLSSLVYSDHIRNEKTQMQIDAFCSTMEGMKQVSGNYLKMEKGYAENWANSMKAYNFLEFIRSYNFENYNEVNDLEQRLLTTDKGLMIYKNSKGEDCYWYYSAFDDNGSVDILGSIPVSVLNSHTSNWFIVFLTCGILMLLVVIDGAYILNINHKLRKTAEMAEYANQAKTRFLSSMSHDIRTPMNAVIGMTDIARKYADNPVKVRECLDKVSFASNHLLTLINDILDISKVESGNMVLNPAMFSVKELKTKLVNIVLPQIKEKKLNFIVEDEELPYEYLIADELRLNQIFINLLSNAVKYTNSGGTIRLIMQEELITEDSSQVCLICTISDPGFQYPCLFGNYCKYGIYTDRNRQRTL